MKDDDIEKMNILIYKERLELLGTKYNTARQKAELESKIMSIAKYFGLRGDGDIHGMQRDYFRSLASKQFLEVLKFEFDRSKKTLTAQHLKELSDSMFFEAFHLHDIEYLKKLVNKLEIDLKSVSGFSKGGILCTAINSSTDLPNIKLMLCARYFSPPLRQMRSPLHTNFFAAICHPPF